MCKLFMKTLIQYLKKNNIAWEYPALLLIYFLIRILDVLEVEHFVTLIFPLNFLYFSKLLFLGGDINPAIAGTVIAPSNASLIYPPGIYILSKLLGNVRNVFYFLFVVQATVPLLVFRLLSPISPRLFAFAVAILITSICTSACTWYPDFIIQPIMAGVLVVILVGDKKLNLSQLVLCGIASGLIVLLKHNIGIFFMVLCGTIIFFQSSSFSEKNNSRIPAYFFLLGFLGFGLLFLTKLPHVDEIVFYLFPYFAFWTYILYLFHTGKLHLNSVDFLRRGAIYTMTALVMPVVIFLHFVDVIGFKRYWHSLFGMGLDHIAFWDTGIIAIARSYANFSSIGAGYMSLILLTTILAPLFINLTGVGALYFCQTDNNQEKLERIIAVSVGVMAVFLLFPLEDHKIAITKFFIFGYVFSRLLRNLRQLSWRILTVLVVLLLIPSSWLAWRHFQSVIETPVASSTPTINKIVGLPMNESIARELDGQIRILQRAIDGKPYFVLASPTYNLMYLPILVDNVNPQYYVRFDNMAMTSDVVRATIMEIQRFPYVIIPSGDYQDYLSGKLVDTGFGEILTYVANGYEVVDEFVKPTSSAIAAKHIDDFLVLKKVK